MEKKVEALKTELGYWESYLASNTYIAGSEFTLAGEPCLLDAVQHVFDVVTGIVIAEY